MFLEEIIFSIKRIPNTTPKQVYSPKTQVEVEQKRIIKNKNQGF